MSMLSMWPSLNIHWISDRSPNQWTFTESVTAHQIITESLTAHQIHWISDRSPDQWTFTKSLTAHWINKHSLNQWLPHWINKHSLNHAVTAHWINEIQWVFTACKHSLRQQVFTSLVSIHCLMHCSLLCINLVGMAVGRSGTACKLTCCMNTYKILG